MKFTPLLLICVLASGCASMQTPAPKDPAEIAREQAENELHNGMLRLLAASQDGVASPTQTAQALKASPEFASR